MQRIKELLNDSSMQKSFEEFANEQEDETWKLWVQFVFHDCFSYIGLCLAIRGCDWKLRMTCLKLMSPLFAALDHSTYERIIPNHLADIQQYPSDILQCLASGGFTVNVTGHSGHAVALDEAHEMCINKDLKGAVVHPTQAYLQKTTLFLTSRIKAYKNLVQQLFPGRAKVDLSNDITEDTPHAKHQEENIQQMCEVISSNKLFDLQQQNRGIVNVFSGNRATKEQASDMLNCYTLGTESFHNYIKFRILKQPSSTNARLRKHQLLTMASPKPKRQKASPQEKETKQVIQCLRRKLAWCKYNAQPDALNNDQYSVLPRAIADEEGYPHKGNKSRWTDKLESRYKLAEPTIFTNSPLWTPQVAVIDAMFLINIRPLRRTKTITEYTTLLFNQVVIQYYKAGTNEVHLVFDKPGRQTFNPKAFEHRRRYSKSNTINQHQHCTFTPDSTIPSKWQDHIECRECKRSIVEAIGLSLLQQGRSLLRGTQKLVLSGCFSGENEDDAWSLSPNESVAELTTLYHSNAEESDNRMWRHAYQSWATRILIYSPDTDTYNIGLGLLVDTTKQFIMQLNVLHASEKRYLSLNNLHMALLNDPDLAMLPRNSISETAQVLFISTGCDFVSFFKTLGKATILNNFFQHSRFIGCLNKVLTHNKEEGFLAFIRLIGTTYFKKHISAFISLYGFQTPQHLFNSLDASLELNVKHEVWLQKIQSVVNNRITTEEEKVPSHTSLWRHWLRTCWIIQMWKNSTLPDIYSSLPRPEESGWICHDGTYVIDWEAPEVQKMIQGNIDFLLKGCTCKKGCKTNICGCRKRKSFCGPGCLCQGCTNVKNQDDNDDDDDSSSAGDSDSNVEGDDLDEEILSTEIITDAFQFEVLDPI